MVTPPSRIALTAISLILSAAMQAQSPQPGSRPASAMQPPADLAQLMKGIVFPSANVFFAAQTDDPAAIKPDSKPAVSPNLLTSTFGKWEAVENSALALAESAALLTLPGRRCSNGAEVPVRTAEWEKLTAQLREAGMTAFQAARSRNQDNVINAAEAVTTACSSCHARYREKSNRCR